MLKGEIIKFVILLYFCHPLAILLRSNPFAILVFAAVYVYFLLYLHPPAVSFFLYLSFYLSLSL